MCIKLHLLSIKFFKRNNKIIFHYQKQVDFTSKKWYFYEKGRKKYVNQINV